MLPAATFAWLLTPFVGGMLVGRSARARGMVARHLGICLAVGWVGVAGLVWGATALDESAGVIAFVVGGPLGAFSFWSRSPDGGGGDDDAPRGPEPVPPDWDWEAFARDLRDWERSRPVGGSPPVDAPVGPLARDRPRRGSSLS